MSTAINTVAAEADKNIQERIDGTVSRVLELREKILTLTGKLSPIFDEERLAPEEPGNPPGNEINKEKKIRQQIGDLNNIVRECDTLVSRLIRGVEL